MIFFNVFQNQCPVFYAVKLPVALACPVWIDTYFGVAVGELGERETNMYFDCIAFFIHELQRNGDLHVYNVNFFLIFELTYCDSILKTKALPHQETC